MTIEILEDTFRPATADAAEVGSYLAGMINGRVTVDIGRQTVEAWAIKYDGGGHVKMSALGFVGRYRTGTKVWRASVMLTCTGMMARFGRDDRTARHQKNLGISFDPEAFFAV